MIARIARKTLQKTAFPRSRRPLLLAVGLLVVTSCTSAPRFRSSPEPVGSGEPARNDVPAPSTSAPERPEVVRIAKSFLGIPYRNGGASARGMDCSGLVMTVFRELDIQMPRTSLAQSRVGETVPRTDVQPGDLVFFKTGRLPVSHVGIYIGSGKFVHASTSARCVRVDDLESDYFRHRFVVAKRVLD